jgi:hypothetical protein
VWVWVCFSARGAARGDGRGGLVERGGFGGGGGVVVVVVIAVAVGHAGRGKGVHFLGGM